jgi:hypothetical protein
MKAKNPKGLLAKPHWRVFRVWYGAVILLSLTVADFPVHASHHYTVRHLDFLATRVGKTYWIVAVNNRIPSFLSTPAASASSFQPQANEAFEITELTGREQKNPYYKVKFDSGKEGYIQPDRFLEELNLTIASVDPQAYEKKKAAEAAAEEKKRVAWIQAQPWPPGIKEAAVKRQVIGGMNEVEVAKILGSPTRKVRVKAQLNVAEEHWLYPDGSTAIFFNGLLNRIESRPATPQPRTEHK